MTHTPGPWSADYGDFAAYCETGAEVCEVTRGSHDDGERPDRNCKYSQWLNDCDRFLLGKEVET